MSGPGSLPPAPPAAPTQPPPVRDGSPARILDASGTLAQLARPATVTGQVVSLSPDGSVRVHTDQGDVTLQPRGAAASQLLSTGQTVEIDLSAGRPPRQAIVRPADSQISQAPTSRAGAPPPATAAQTPNAAAPAPGTAGTEDDGNGAGSNQGQSTLSQSSASRPPPPLLTETLASNLAESATSASNTAPLSATPVVVRPGDLVRLLPLPPDGVLQVEPGGAVLAATLQDGLAIPQPVALVASAKTTPTAPTLLTAKAPPPFIKAPGATPLLNTPLTAPTLKRQPFTALPAAPAAGGLPTSPKAALTLAPVLPASAARRPALALTSAPPIGAAKPIVALAATSTLFANRGAGQTLDIRLTAIEPAAPRFVATSTLRPAGLPPLLTAPSALLAGGPTRLTGVIVGHVIPPAGGGSPLPVLSLILPGQSTPRLFAVQTAAANLPVGTQIIFTPPADAADQATPADDAQSLSLPAAQWPVLTAVRDAATLLLPHISSPLAALLPSPSQPAQLPATALLFMAALRASDLAGWLGGHVEDALRRAGQDDLLGRLAAEGAALAPLDAPPATADGWRTLPMPLLYQGDIQRAILRYRRNDGDKDGKERRRRQTRFVFDMALERMGPVQLDGLHQPKTAAANDDRLDLIVRTREKVSAPMQAAMRLRYHAALDSCGHQGEMLFQFRPEQWLRF